MKKPTSHHIYSFANGVSGAPASAIDEGAPDIEVSFMSTKGPELMLLRIPELSKFDIKSELRNRRP